MMKFLRFVNSKVNVSMQLGYEFN